MKLIFNLWILEKCDKKWKSICVCILATILVCILRQFAAIATTLFVIIVTGIVGIQTINRIAKLTPPNEKRNMASMLMRYVLIPLVVSIVKVIVTTYTVLTWPLYYVTQKPWRKLENATRCGGHLVDKGRLSENVIPDLRGSPYLEYERFAEIPYHPLMDCETIAEALETVVKLYPLDQPSHGYREIIDEQIQYDAAGQPIRVDGKVLRKYVLSNHYHWLTLGEVYEKINSFGRGLAGPVGVKPGDRVVIFADTSLHFFCSTLANNMFGATTITLFSTLHDDGLVHALNETRVKYMITSFELLDRIGGIIAHCPALEHIIYIEGPNKLATTSMIPSTIRLWPFSEVENYGRSQPYCQIAPCPPEPNEICFMMYTSGTTGFPKGVTVTGRQIKEAALAIGQVVRDLIPTGPSHTYIAYLPQAHVLELTVEMFLFLGNAKIGYASPFTLYESAPGLTAGTKCDLHLLRPTVMSVVPLVLDRMQKEIYHKLSQRTPFSRRIYEYLINYKSYWIERGYQTPIVNRLLCSKVSEQFGNRLQYMVIGGAPLAPRLQRMIRNSLEITLLQGYGCTETCGGVLCMDMADQSYGRVGAPLNGVRIRLVDWPEGGYTIEDKPNPRGELLIGGRMISSGYFELDELTQKTFFEENGLRWLASGDIAEVFPDGTFSIIDRKKDLIKLANGEFVSLGKIEARLKSNDYVDDICVMANGIVNGMIALVVPNRRTITELIRSKQLHLDASRSNKDDKEKQQNISKTIDLQSVEEYFCNPALIESVHRSIIDTGLQQSLKPIELPSLIMLCIEQWMPDNDLLTVAMKLKRANIAKKYKQDIERMYSELQQNPNKIINRNNLHTFTA